MCVSLPGGRFGGARWCRPEWLQCATQRGKICHQYVRQVQSREDGGACEGLVANEKVKGGLNDGLGL